jgi:DNA-binding SARP family transcriptional activator
MGSSGTQTFGSTDGTGDPPQHEVRLLGDFTVRCAGRELHLSADAQRLVAFLALRRSAVQRTTVAGNLWADSTQDRAFGNLRSALWRVQRTTKGLLEATGSSLRIADAVVIDVDLLIERHVQADGRDVAFWPYRSECLLFSHELLADWHDEWVLVERERVRQTALHLLESMSEQFAAEGHYPAAMEAAMAAIRLDPLRESAHRCAVRVHLAEGNYSDAIHHVDGYTALLRGEMGIDPSPQLRALLRAHDIVVSSRTTPTCSPGSRARVSVRFAKRRPGGVASQTSSNERS